MAKSIEGLGPLSYEAQRGLYLHPTYVVTPDREPLGVIDAWLWAREFKDADGNRPGILESTPISRPVPSVQSKASRCYRDTVLREQKGPGSNYATELRRSYFQQELLLRPGRLRYRLSRNLNRALPLS
jgi:hypothetical protein